MDKDRVNDYCIYYANKDAPCSKISNLKNGFCDVHQDEKAQFDMYCAMDKKFCLKFIKEKINYSHGLLRAEKLPIIIEIYDFLCIHKLFLYNTPKFCDAVYEKLCQFNEENHDDFDAKRYLRELFPLTFINNNNNNDNNDNNDDNDNNDNTDDDDDNDDNDDNEFNFNSNETITIII